MRIYLRIQCGDLCDRCCKIDPQILRSSLKSSNPQILRFDLIPGVLSQHVLAIVPRTPDDRDVDRFPGDTLFPSRRPCVLPCWMLTAQGAVRSVGNGEAGAAALSRRPRRRSGRRTRLARPGDAAARQLVVRARSSWTRRCRPRARNCTRRWSRRGPGCRDALPLSPGRSTMFPLLPTDIVVSSHACGALTDRVLEGAVAVRARVAVLPCCHHLGARTISPCRCRCPVGWTARPPSISCGQCVSSSRAIASGPRRFPPALRRRTVCCWAHQKASTLSRLKAQQPCYGRLAGASATTRRLSDNCCPSAIDTVDARGTSASRNSGSCQASAPSSGSSATAAT